VTFGARTGFWRDDARPPARAPRSIPEPERPRPPLPQVGPRYRSFDEIMADEGDQEEGP
jgi:hypothetical protein